MKHFNLPSATSLIGCIGLICILLFTFTVSLSAQTSAGQKKTTKASMEETWGIEILGVRSTAANYMLDFRYRVIDAEKANPLFRRKSRPQLIEQETGAQMGVYSSPKTGPMRTTNMPKNDRNYFILFANPGKQIKVGNKVTVVIDDFKAENITVQ